MYGDAEYMYTNTPTQGGNDILNAAMGGTNGGNDILYGNTGSDIFITGSNTNADIRDYNQDEGDKIAGNPGSGQQQDSSSQIHR